MVADCAGNLCNTAEKPDPERDALWGPVFRMTKSDGTSGRVAIGDVVEFQRLDMNLVTWCDNCYIRCDPSNCGGTRLGERSTFTVCSETNCDLGPPNLGQWVTKYNISYSLDNNVWKNYETTLPANTDWHTVVQNRLQPAIVARHVRIDSVQWHASTWYPNSFRNMASGNTYATRYVPLDLYVSHF